MTYLKNISMKDKVLEIINHHIRVATSMWKSNQDNEFYKGMLAILYLIEPEIRDLYEA